ncbi:hypothetical protein ACHAXT_009366 [Thalassiosira profunda]
MCSAGSGKGVVNTPKMTSVLPSRVPSLPNMASEQQEQQQPKKAARTAAQHHCIETSQSMIEATLYEMIPALDTPTAQRVARQLAPVLLASQSRDDKASIKVQLKRISRRLLAAAERRRRISPASSGTSTPVEDGATPPQPASAEPWKRPSVDERHRVLADAVGEANCRELASVAAEIRHIRGCSALWTKFTRQTPLADGEEPLPAAQSLPPPISDLYFRVPLVASMSAFEARAASASSPHPCESLVRNSDWIELLDDARKKLAAYRAFEREHVGEGEAPTFRCSGGRCGWSGCSRDT